ncbi:MAG TPA: SOS response-associated peptidase [Firmicutes bacterium]|nr:SOS response-associated peptidase [Bacillota bacterium]
MCGRFTLHTPLDELAERFSLLELPFDYDYTPSYNIAPTNMVLTVLPRQAGLPRNAAAREQAEGSRMAALLRWGLTLPWQKPGSKPLINARLETIAEKPSFRNLVNTHRCLILADGFYEWKTENGGKYPLYFTLDGGRPFAFAGLWQEGDTPSCTIITQPAASFMQPIHDRMPLILTPETENLWLSPLSFKELAAKLPDPEERPLAYHRVSKMVNSPRNNSIECIQPVS